MRFLPIILCSIILPVSCIEVVGSVGNPFFSPVTQRATKYGLLAGTLGYCIDSSVKGRHGLWSMYPYWLLSFVGVGADALLSFSQSYKHYQDAVEEFNFLQRRLSEQKKAIDQLDQTKAGVAVEQARILASLLEIQADEVDTLRAMLNQDRSIFIKDGVIAFTVACAIGYKLSQYLTSASSRVIAGWRKPTPTTDEGSCALVE